MVSWFARLSWSQRVGSVAGAVYVLIGVVGFAVTSGVGFAALRGRDLMLFELNPLHNFVYLGIGAALLYAALNSASATRLMNRPFGGTYLAVAVVGAFIVEADTSLSRGLSEQRSELNILALNQPDNFSVGTSICGSAYPVTSWAEVRRSSALRRPVCSSTSTSRNEV